MCGNVFLPFSLFDLMVHYIDRLASKSVFNSVTTSFKRTLLVKKYINVQKLEKWKELK